MSSITVWNLCWPLKPKFILKGSLGKINMQNLRKFSTFKKRLSNPLSSLYALPSVFAGSWFHLRLLGWQARGPTASSGPSLSLPVLDSGRSARGGSLPSFSRKWCRKIFKSKCLPQANGTGPRGEATRGFRNESAAVLTCCESFCAGHRVYMAHRHQWLSFLK